ncbi:hypothetical protein PAECIP111893_03940 [Paenibacillus plantiphilus]|uniref:AAA domain-containing protein n=1 Tax=Paenibacillus plantiphilus TaxID=2905650 RepID=A0ABN8GVH3_9BACL|nr:AAA family ATPase [Paenibacillus plantiphilus]CAH1215372.1 hypothetical protein PAECIP111893_03940 [Paenibacillus plantiphilus]
MRWVGMHAEGFGKLYDSRFHLDAPVTIIYGPNEAGKSTTLAFIRTMLYGFATRANAVDRQEPVAGGRHGGRLLFRDESGNSYVLERYANSAGKVTLRRTGEVEGALVSDDVLTGLRNGAGSEGRLFQVDVKSSKGAGQAEVLTQAMWEKLYLGGVNDRVFRELFAITLTELQAIGMLEGDELGKQLYHAGWSGGGAIAGTEKLLGGQLDELYRPRGVNQRINRLIKALDGTEAALRQLEDSITGFNELTDALRHSELALSGLEDRLPVLRERALLLERAVELHPVWVERAALLREKADLHLNGQVPLDARSRWEAHAAERNRILDERERIKLAYGHDERALELLQYDDRLIAAASETEGLVLSLESMQALRLQKSELFAEQREQLEELERLLLRIAPNWGERELRALHVTIAEREEVRKARMSLLQADRERERIAAELRALRDSTRELSLQLEESGGLDESALVEGQRKARELDSNAGVRGTTATIAMAQSGGARESIALSGRTREAIGESGKTREAIGESGGTREAIGESGKTREAIGESGKTREAIGESGEIRESIAELRETGEAALWQKQARGADVFVLLPATSNGLRHAARVFEDAWREWELEKVRSQHGNGEVVTEGRSPVVLWAAAIALAAAAGLLAAGGWTVAAAAAGAAALALAAAALLRAREARSARPSGAVRAGRRGNAPRRTAGGAAAEQAAAAAQARLAAAERRVAAALGALVREPEAALAALLANAAADAGPLAANGQRAPSASREQLRAAIDARLDALRDSEHVAERRQEHLRALARLRAQEAAAQAAANEAASSAGAIALAWRDWLAARSLPSTLSPEAAMETFDLAEQAMQRLQARDRIAVKLAVIEAQLAAFEAAASELAAAFTTVTRGANGDLAASLRMLQAEARKGAEARQRAIELRARMTDLALRSDECNAVLQRLDTQRDEWYRQAGVADESSWLAAIMKSERLHEINTECYRLDAKWTAGMTEAQRGQLESWYEEADHAVLEQMREAASNELRQAEAARTEWIETTGRQRQKLEAMLQHNDRQRLIADREEKTAALEGLVSRYALLSFGMTMIRRTKRIMEEQRQPAVLREASRMMEKMSGGKYIRISVPEGEQTIGLETSDGYTVDSKFLSRGTAEQLYLAMRFALADEAAVTVNMPMILDDLFVNFDRSRLEAVVEVLAELAQRRQLVLLTCHEHIRDLLMDRLSGAKLVHLA